MFQTKSVFHIKKKQRYIRIYMILVRKATVRLKTTVLFFFKNNGSFKKLRFKICDYLNTRKETWCKGG